MNELTINNKQHNTKAYLALGVTSIVWGTSWVASRFGVRYTPALQLSSTRQFLAGSLFIIFFLFKGEKLPSLKQFGWLAMLSLFTFVGANGLSTWSVQYISSGLAALISALYPICVVLIEWLVLKRNNNTPLTFVGLIIGISGVAIVFYENAFHQQPAGYGFGVLLGFLSMITWSIGTILVARNKQQMNPYYAIGWQMFISSFVIYTLAKFTNHTIPFSQIPYQSWLSIAYLICMGSITAFVAFIYTIKYLPQAIASLYAYINPVVAILAGAILLQEPLTGNILIGSIITIVGVYLVNRSLKKR